MAEKLPPLPDSDKLKRLALFVPCPTKEALHRWIKVYLGIDLPDTKVDPESNSSPMDLIWELYDAALNNKPGYSQVLAYAARDSFKTFAAAIFEVLAIVHLERSCAHMAAIEPQAKKSQQYLKKHFNRPYLRDYVTLKNERMVEITRFYSEHDGVSLTVGEWNALPPAEQAEYREIKNYVTIVICTVQGANSEHVPLMIVDEVDVVENPDAYEEAKMIPAPINGKMPITLYTSTRKYSYGLVQKEIDKAEDTGLVIRHWNLIDMTQPCPASRHQPELPKVPIYVWPDELRAVGEDDYGLLTTNEKAKYEQVEGYAGCLKNCRMFAACRGRLATEQKSASNFLKPIEHTQTQFRRVTLEKAKAQLLCWKPSTEGLIYPNFNREIHMLTAAQMAEKVTGEKHDPDLSKAQLIDLFRSRGARFVSGMDHGFTHNFAVVTGAVDGNRMFIFDVIAQPELELSQKLQMCRERIFDWGPDIYADPEAPADNKTFKREGFRIREWSKGPKSVVDGISIVRLKLMPTFGRPEDAQLFFLKGDEGCEFLAKRISQYHWKTDAAGRITNIPDETEDDECDAMRYGVMNTFAPKTKANVAADTTPATLPRPPTADKQYSQKDWVRQVVFEQTGHDITEESEQSQAGTRGKRGNFAWDL